MILAAMLEVHGLVTAGAAVFAGGAVASAVVSHLEPWRKRGFDADHLMLAWGRLRQLVPLQVIAYAWGAVAMQGLYLTPLTGLKWQHGWQYALALALLAALSAAYVRMLWPPPVPDNEGDPTARWTRLGLPLVIGQGVAAGGLLGWLLVSGKLASIRADWAANRVFVAVAVAIVAISVMGALTHMGRTRRA